MLQQPEQLIHCSVKAVLPHGTVPHRILRLQLCQMNHIRRYFHVSLIQVYLIQIHTLFPPVPMFLSVARNISRLNIRSGCEAGKQSVTGCNCYLTGAASSHYDPGPAIMSYTSSRFFHLLLHTAFPSTYFTHFSNYMKSDCAMCTRDPKI